MSATALEQFPIVTDVAEAAANTAPVRGEPLELPTWLCVWDVFAALQDAAEEQGATPQEADDLVLASYCSIQQWMIPGAVRDSES